MTDAGMNSGIRILIAEDSIIQAEMLRRMLLKEGYTVEVAHNGLEGLAMARRLKPSLVISDIIMPEMDGYLMCCEIKKDEALKDIPVILLTSLTEIADVVRGINAGADSYITKPYDESYLLQKVDSLLKSPPVRIKEGMPGSFEIAVNGDVTIVKPDSLQILNLLLSTYENAILQNRSLWATTQKLENLNSLLEEKVVEVAAEKKRFATLVETLPDIVYRIDLSGNFVLLNDAVRRLGYEPEELIGRHFSEIMLPADVEDVSRDKVIPRFKESVTGDEGSPKLFDERRTGGRRTTGLEIRLVSKGKTKVVPAVMDALGEEAVVVEVSSSGLYEIISVAKNPILIGTVGVIRDITERKQMETELRAHRDHLEALVSERTTELVNANRQLSKEMAVRAQTEEELKKSEELFRAIFDNATDGILLADIESKRFIEANAIMCRMLGYNLYEIRALGVADIHPPEDLSYVVEQFERQAKGDFTLATDIPVRRKDGSVFYADINSSAVILAGKSYLLGMFRDITDRMHAEEALQKSEAFISDILQSVGEGFIVIDPEYRIISANRAYCEQVKSPDCDIIGRPCYKVSHHIDKPCFLEGVECAPMHTFKTSEPHFAIHTHYDKDNNPVYIETKSFPMKDAGGSVIAVIETLINITEKRTLEDQLRHVQKMEAVGTLAGGIAHDFNNMLNVIIGYAALMQMHMQSNDPMRLQLKEILAAGDRAAHLTKGLLAFSRKQVMEVRTADLNEIVEGFRKMLVRMIGENIELKTSLSEQHLTAKVDIVQIEQVLMNLAVNARDAMPKGGTLSLGTATMKIDRTFIKTHGYGEPGWYGLITVSDTGAGMDAKTRERIFEPFFTTKDIGRGTGLGLAIVYGIVKQHNGYITCYSEPGKGTTFKIYIPLVRAESDMLATAEAKVPKGGTETILVAEDDLGVRGLIRDALEGFGYRIIEAVDGEDAVKKFRESKDSIQLLLSDVIMPKKNGKDAYEDIKGIRHDIKALFMSGYASDIIQRFGIDEDIEFISKPVSPNELLRKVREALDK